MIRINYLFATAFKHVQHEPHLVSSNYISSSLLFYKPGPPWKYLAIIVFISGCDTTVNIRIGCKGYRMHKGST